MGKTKKEKELTDKQQAIQAAVEQVEKQFGKGAIMRLGDDSVNTKIESIPTGSIGLDGALGIGGVPKGRIVEVYGLESVGKSLLTLQIIAEAQKLGGSAAYVDAEFAYAAGFAKQIGVDIDELLVSQPSSGEESLSIVETLILSNAFDVIVVDSVAALVPQKEIEGDMGDSHVALQARLMSQGLRKLTGIVSKSKTCLIFVNQLRDRIGIIFGNPSTTVGGNSLKYYASVRLEVKKIESIKEKENIIGNRIRVKVVKSKVSPPFKQAEFDLYFDSGICRESEVIDLGSAAGIIQKAGTWYSYDDIRLGQGKEQSRQFLMDNPEIMEELTEKIYKNFLNKNEISDIALAVETLYDLRDESNLLVKDAKTKELIWNDQSYTYRQLVRFIDKNNLYDELKEKVEVKMNKREDEENKINI